LVFNRRDGGFLQKGAKLAKVAKEGGRREDISERGGFDLIEKETAKWEGGFFTEGSKGSKGGEGREERLHG
jgi:hypothetical protein